MNWLARAGSAPHYQGQVYDDTGKTVAVIYDDEGGDKARLAAAAPGLRRALERIAGTRRETGASVDIETARLVARAALREVQP